MVGVTIQGLKKRFGAVSAVDDVDLDIRPGEFLVLLGPSGCGKTTLLRCLSGLERVTAGRILFDGLDVTYLPARQRNLSMVFQSYAVWPHMTVRDNVAFTLRIKSTPRPEVARRVAEAADLLGIEELLDRYPAQLSGGQRQRVAVARAIVVEPKVLLMDEPLSNLDALLRVRMRSEVKKLQQRLGVTTAYVTHDQVEAMTMGDRIVVLRDGKLQQVGASDEIYHRPANTFVAGFVGSPQMNFIEVEAVSRDGRPWLDARGLSMPVPDELRARLAAFPARKDYLLGIRPEHIHVSAPPGAAAATKGAVYFVELLRSDTVIHLEKEFGVLVIKAPGDLKVKEGETLEVSLELAGMHLFDRDTGRAV